MKNYKDVYITALVYGAILGTYMGFSTHREAIDYMEKCLENCSMPRLDSFGISVHEVKKEMEHHPHLPRNQAFLIAVVTVGERNLRRL